MLDNLARLQSWMRDREPAPSETLQPEALMREGAQQALALFHSASLRVRAYRDFLREQKFDPASVTTIDRFQDVPATTKENYISRYDLADRCWDGRLDQVHIISSSSGTSGQMHFWPRTLSTEIEGAVIYERLYREVFRIDRRRTLLLDAFALGNGIAGTFTLAGANLLSWKGYQLTSMTPGYSLDDVVPLLKTIAPAFDQTIIAGMSPFLKEVIETAHAEGVDFKKVRVRLTGAGQGFNEEWRRYVLELLHADDYHHSVLSLYGSADAALMAFETPLAISLRSELARQPGRSKELFRDERLPCLFNYDPHLTFFEAKNGELHLTKDAGVPLLRYNIHDCGGVLPFAALAQDTALAEVADRHPQWHLPFVYLFGRDRFMAKFYGANIYTENVQMAMSQPELQPVLTGRFLLEVVSDEAHRQRLYCRVELNQGVQPSSDLTERVHEVFIHTVTAVNSEYNALTKIMGARAAPVIQLVENGNAAYFPRGRKTS